MRGLNCTEARGVSSSLLSGNIPANRLFYSRENVAIKADRRERGKIATALVMILGHKFGGGGSGGVL